MKKLAFVTPWYGRNIRGGAEMELRGLTDHLVEAGVDLEILTTCVESFNSDWNHNHYKEGITEEEGVLVHRFPVRTRDVKAFDAVNCKLMNNIQITKEEECTYMEEMINSPALYTYISEHKEDYALFIYIPYMFGTTYYGVKACPEKSVLIPCLHDESYAYMSTIKEMFYAAGGIVYNAYPEKELAHCLYKNFNVNEKVLGCGVYTDWSFDQNRFREKYRITEPFLLYAGRKELGKNVHILIRYFDEYKRRNQNDLKLVLIGGGEIDIPQTARKDIVDLGFVDIQDKYDAYGASLALCQPSTHESFSIVIMESWLGGRPVLVHGGCEVTKDFAVRTGGGLYFEDYFEFEGCVNYYLEHEDIASRMGTNGGLFVKENFAWDKIVENYMRFFRECSGEEE